MKAYHINELERLTGIKAHTIRIWEKRYGLITPGRTTTNRRYYNDNEVRKLLNVSTLLTKGRKISHIAALTESELNEEIQGNEQHANEGNINARYINDLIKCMLVFDEAGFEKAFSAVVTRLGMYEAMLQVIYPFLGKVGMLWSVDKAAPVQEHFATCIIRRKVIAATDVLLPASNKAEKFLLFLPEHEWHEIGLLFANYMIRSKGYETVYLGQNVPFEHVRKIIPVIAPQYILLFYIATRPKEEVAQQLKAYAKTSNTMQVLVAGNKELLEGGKTKIKNVTYLTDVNGLLDHL